MGSSRRAKTWRCLIGSAIIASIAVLGLCDTWVSRAARGKCFACVTDVPDAPAALVLGCCEFLPDGRKNLYFERRIAAAAELFRAGKVQVLIASGDNHRADYDEPTAMKAALVRAGIPQDRVVCDFAGFRTLDSVLRAEQVFGQRRIVVVSQRFHCERAIFLAREHGIEAFGFDADEVGGPAGFKTRLRECAARFVAAMDVALLDTSPKFIGPPIKLALEPVRLPD